MKKIVLVLLAITLLGLAVGCDESITYTYANLLGEWDFPGYTHVSVMQDESNPTDKKLDIRWQENNTEYFVMADGTATGATFTGTYSYNVSDATDPDNPIFQYYYGDDVDEPPKNISITLSLVDNKLKAVCTGDAPLGGKTFTLGSKEEE